MNVAKGIAKKEKRKTVKLESRDKFVQSPPLPA